MPRVTRSLVAALLLSVFLLSNPAQAQLRVSGTAPLPAAPTSPSNSGMPVRLVKRSEQAEEAASPSRYGQPIELPVHQQTAPGTPRQPLEDRASSSSNVTSVVLSSLAIVLGLFFLVVWLARRALPKSTTSLPSDVLEVLGRSPLASRHHLQLVRLGRRLLLISVTPDGAETLTEITDPDEVNHLATLCQQQQPGSITGSFRQVLHQLGSQPTTRAARSAKASDDSTLDASAPTERRPSLRHAREMS